MESLEISATETCLMFLEKPKIEGPLKGMEFSVVTC